MEILHLMSPVLVTPILTGLLRRQTERDELIKFIRKSATMNLLSSRMLAARGYLILLEFSKVETAIEQSQHQGEHPDDHIPIDNATAFCDEFLDCLRRSLTQQVQVKQVVYMAAFDVLRFNPGIASNLLRIFLPICYENGKTLYNQHLKFRVFFTPDRRQVKVTLVGHKGIELVSF